MKGEGGKGLLGSGVEYCGICLNGVREVLGVLWYLAKRVVIGVYCSTGQDGNGGVLLYLATHGVSGSGGGGYCGTLLEGLER